MTPLQGSVTGVKEIKKPVPRAGKPALTCCAPEGTRTPNLLIRSQMLYPLSYGRRCPTIVHGRLARRLRDSNPGGAVSPNRISSAAP